MRTFYITIILLLILMSLAVFGVIKLTAYHYETQNIDNLTTTLENQKKELEKPIEPVLMEEVKQGKTFVFIDLDEMQLILIDKGDVIKAYKILSIRKIDSKFDTPTGEFKTLTKERNHFSSIGHVWMPYSVQFYDNFFLHGWPYYPDGTDVAQGYSGGCIRLGTEDMKEVYDFIKVGMPIVVK